MLMVATTRMGRSNVIHAILRASPTLALEYETLDSRCGCKCVYRPKRCRLKHQLLLSALALLWMLMLMRGADLFYQVHVWSRYT